MSDPVRQKATEIANSKQASVVEGVYNYLLSSHNSLRTGKFCHCEYCCLLRKYREAKIILTRKKRWLYNDDKEYFRNERSPWQDEVVRQEQIVSDLKYEKDYIKFIKKF